MPASSRVFTQSDREADYPPHPCRHGRQDDPAGRTSRQTREEYGEARLSAATGLSVETVALYQPLLFPLALQLGCFFFLAYGLSPRREETAKLEEKAATPATKPAVNALPLLPAGIVSFDNRAAMRAEK
jgi:hypothetical protein